jgi:MerR family copper efflux transcriptional regulator
MFMGDLRISELAERSGVPATTLRFYEDVGLLHTDRAPNGYRRYGQGAVERLGFITAAKQLGLPLEEITELLNVWTDGSCAQVRDDLRPRLARRIAEAEKQASELAAFTATLHAACEHLDAVPSRPGRCDSQCGFLPSQPAAGAQPGTLHRTREDAQDDQAWRTAPVACTLDGPAMSDRISQWQDLLRDAGHQPIPDGIRVTIPADRAAHAAGLAAAEQACCPFFDFRLHLTGHRLHLDIRAPAEAAGMITDLFTPRLPRLRHGDLPNAPDRACSSSARSRCSCWPPSSRSAVPS